MGFVISFYICLVVTLSGQSQAIVEEKEEIRKIYNRDTIKETKVSIPLQIRGGSDFTL
jgi:hypothetical protein